MFQGVKKQVDSTNYHVYSLRFHIFHAGFQLGLNLVYLCLNLNYLCLTLVYLRLILVYSSASQLPPPCSCSAPVVGGRNYSKASRNLNLEHIWDAEHKSKEVGTPSVLTCGVRVGSVVTWWSQEQNEQRSEAGTVIIPKSTCVFAVRWHLRHVDQTKATCAKSLSFSSWQCSIQERRALKLHGVSEKAHLSLQLILERMWGPKRSKIQPEEVH